MYNRYINTKKDFSKQNEHANLIEPAIRNAKFESEEEKEMVLNWARKTFFNQWKTKVNK